MRVHQELKEEEVHQDPLESLGKRVKLVFLAFLDPLVEMVYLVLVGFLVFLVLKVTLERMVSREKSARLDPKVSREARGTSDLLEVLAQEDSEEKLGP